MNANTAIATFRATFRWNSHEPPFIKNAVIRAVAATMYADMHYLMKMAANAPDTDSDAILAFYLFTRRRRRKGIYRGIYIHPILQKRHFYGKSVPPPSEEASLPPIKILSRETMAEFHENKRTD